MPAFKRDLERANPKKFSACGFIHLIDSGSINKFNNFNDRDKIAFGIIGVNLSIYEFLRRSRLHVEGVT